MQFVEEDDVIRSLEFTRQQQLPGIYNVAGDGRLPWSEVASLCGKRVVPMPPVLTGLVTAPLERLGILELPPEMLALLRYGRGSTTGGSSGPASSTATRRPARSTTSRGPCTSGRPSATAGPPTSTTPRSRRSSAIRRPWCARRIEPPPRRRRRARGRRHPRRPRPAQRALARSGRRDRRRLRSHGGRRRRGRGGRHRRAARVLRRGRPLPSRGRGPERGPKRSRCAAGPAVGLRRVPAWRVRRCRPWPR